MPQHFNLNYLKFISKLQLPPTLPFSLNFPQTFESKLADYLTTLKISDSNFDAIRFVEMHTNDSWSSLKHTGNVSSARQIIEALAAHHTIEEPFIKKYIKQVKETKLKSLKQTMRIPIKVKYFFLIFSTPDFYWESLMKRIHYWKEKSMWQSRKTKPWRFCKHL